MVNANGMVFISYLEKNYDSNHQSSPDAYNLAISHSCGKFLGVLTHAPHFFIYTYALLHMLCAKDPCDTAPAMLPHGEYMTLLQNHPLFLPHCKIYIPHNLEASHAHPPKPFSALSHCSHFWPLHSLS